MSDIASSMVLRDVLADLQAVCNFCNQVASGGVKDPELLRRVRERAQQARAKTLKRFGVQEIGVQIIREMRESR